jgi:hypothetical protein
MGLLKSFLESLLKSLLKKFPKVCSKTDKTIKPNTTGAPKSFQKVCSKMGVVGAGVEVFPNV